MERTLESNVFPEMFEELDIRSSKVKNNRTLVMNRGTFQEGKEKEGFLKATGTLNTMHIVSFRIICVQLLNPFDYVSFDMSCGLM